ncbi:MAG: helix-turn-helix transcriptional regulator [Flavobacteriales bacterium]|nr:helix-turn-helix transcriptional regulator [Flavobacteriales bacterium]
MKPYIKPTKPHKHLGYHEIILITEGEGFHTIEFNRHQVTPPVIFCLKPGQIHHWEFTDKPEGYVLMYKSEFIQDLNISPSDHTDIDPFIQLSKVNDQVVVKGLFDSIEKELTDKKENFKSSISCYLRILLIELERLSKRTDDMTSGTNLKFKMFGELVKRKIKTLKKVNEYAELLHISPKHLNQLCKEACGKTASAVIHGQISTEAKRYLIHTDKNISEIAFELGFDDSSHFSKFFRIQTGLTPSNFRKDRFQ